MGAVGAKVVNVERVRMLLVACVLTALAALVIGVGSARATTCDTNWTGGGGTNDWFTSTNWSSGVPDSTKSACIDTSTVIIDGLTQSTNSPANAKFLQLTGGAELEIIGRDDGTEHQANLTLADGDSSSVGSGSTILMTAACTVTTPCGAPANLTISSGALTNDGIIIADPGSDNGSTGRNLDGSLNNAGTLNVSTVLTVVDGVGSTIKNQAGGVVTNNGGSGYLAVDGGNPANTFEEGGGTTSPATANPTHPAVILDGSQSFPADLDYTGSGASTIEAREQDNLSGNLSSPQHLVVYGSVMPSEALVTASGPFSNAGTITLTGPYDSGLAASGTLTNTGTLIAASTTSSFTREISASLSNAGTFDVNGATAFDGTGATLTQTSGTTLIAPSQTLDMNGSSGLFTLQGGLLEGGGQTQSTEADIEGSGHNTGGNVMPGSASTPGLLFFNGTYTQGSGGTFTEVVKGVGGSGGGGVGKHYSELVTSGNITVGGKLAIKTVANPAVGDLDTILGTNGSRTGKFANVTGVFLPEGAFPPGWTFGYKPDYGFSNAVALDVKGAAGLRVKKAGTGHGTVTSSPAGINCGTKCDAPYFKTQTVTLTEHPASGSRFSGWSGACTGSTTSCRVRMSQARIVTAKFS